MKITDWLVRTKGADGGSREFIVKGAMMVYPETGMLTFRDDDEDGYIVAIFAPGEWMSATPTDPKQE